METIIHSVRDIEPANRQVLETLVGQRLSDDQQVVINVVSPSAAPAPNSPLEPMPVTVPAWWNVYAGLSDEEIEQLDQAIRQRADLTRIGE